MKITSNNKVGFFEEKENVKSSTRLNSFLLLLFLFVFDFYLAINPNFEITFDFVLFNLVMLAGIFTPKYLHKLAELGIKNFWEQRNYK